MKKLLCLFMVFTMCLSAGSVFAEEQDFSGDQISLTIPDISLPEVELSSEARSMATSDVVTVNNGVYDVVTPSGTNLVLDTQGLPYMTFTQSFYASLDVYSRLESDEKVKELIDALIADNIHFYILDTYQAFNYILVATPGSDMLSQHVRNLNSLNENEIKQVAAALANSCGVSDYTLYTFNGNVWIQLGANNLFSIANSEYVNVCFMPKGDSMTEDDYKDFTDFMKALTIK